MCVALQVQPLLQHARWETRAAASECIGLMAQHAQHPTAAQIQPAHAGTLQMAPQILSGQRHLYAFP